MVVMIGDYAIGPQVEFIRLPEHKISLEGSAPGYAALVLGDANPTMPVMLPSGSPPTAA